MSRRPATRPPQSRGFRELPPGARLFIAAVLALAVVALALGMGGHHAGESDPALLAALAVICAGGNLFEIFMPGHWSFQPNMLFFFAGAILLPPWAIALLAVACFLPGYIANRRDRPESFRWYKVAFNIANYLLAGLAAHELARIGGSMPAAADSDVTSALALFAAAAGFTAINHLLIVVAVWLSGERSLWAMAKQLADGVPLDAALCLTGAALAVLWDLAPALVLLAPGPVLLMYRALSVPLLSHTAEELRGEVGVLQAALLPTLPARLGGLDVTVAYRPAEGPVAGGDFYDAFALGEERTAIVLGDASGHGRDAIARSVLMRYTLRAYLEAGLDPRPALRVGGRVLDAPGAGEDFATVVVAVHDAEAGTLTYASAGHPAPIVLGPIPHEPVTACSSPPLGVGVPTGLRQTTIALPEGSIACLFTDGMADARVGDRPLGREGLAAMLAALGPDATAEALVEALAAETGAARDDMAACVIHARGGRATAAVWAEELECDSADVRGHIPERFLRACGFTEEEAEAAAAAIREGRRGALLRVRAGDGRPSLEIVAQRADSDDRLPRPRGRLRRGRPVVATPSVPMQPEPPDS